MSDIVGQHVRLKKNGREWKGLSPFTNEKSPSFTVNDQKQFWHCFSSGEHGDIISFLTKTQNMSFNDALEMLAQRAGLEVPHQKRQDPEQVERAKTTLAALQAATAFFQSQLKQNKSALDYLTQRGLSSQTIEKFGLGFAPKERGALSQALGSQGFSTAIMLEAGLIIQPEDRSAKPYDRFFNRIMFPIDNRKGDIIAFGARALDKRAQAKYLNSPETPLFHKGDNFYALSKASKLAYDKEQLIIVEGYMDVIALHQAGCENVVASLGTALTESQIELAWRFANEPIICLDGDEAGQRAAKRAMERALKILRPGKSLRFAYMPKGKDPDDIIKQAGLEAFEKHIEQAATMSESMFYNETENAALDTPERRAALRQRFDGLIDEIGDTEVKRYYRNLFHRRLEQMFWSLDRNYDRAEKTTSAAPVAPAIVPDGLSGGERIVLGLLIDQPEFLQHYHDEIENLYLASEPHRHLRDAFILASSDEKPADPNWFYQNLGEEYHHLLDVIYGRDSQGLADGHNFYSLFPVCHPSLAQQREENFLERCFKCFIHEQYHQALAQDCRASYEDYQAQFNQENEQASRERWLKIKSLLEEDQHVLFYEVVQLNEVIDSLAAYMDYATGFILKKN